MATTDNRKQNGGRRANSGRKPKPVEDAQHSVLLALFNEEEERAVISNMIAIAKKNGPKQDGPAIAAATWLWERKYGKAVERVVQDTTQRVVVEYADADDPA